MATVSDLIKGSLRLLGVIAQGETPSSQESADALSALNDMIDGWSNDGLLLFDRTIESLSIGTASVYSIGSGGDFNTTRPIRLISANFKESGQNVEYPLRIFTSQQWMGLIDKTLTSNIPLGIYYNDKNPLGYIYPYPILSAAGTLVLESDKPLSSFSAISDTLTLPPGYNRALRYNLAVELAPEYGMSVSDVVAAIAVNSKADLMRTNTEPVMMTSDVPIESPYFDIYRGPFT